MKYLTKYQPFLMVTIISLLSSCSATLVKGNFDKNPLPEIAEKAQQNGYAVELDKNQLKLRETWPIHSSLTLGWTSFHADLEYQQTGDFLGKFYLRNISLLGSLFIPQYIDTGDGFYGGALKPSMRQEMNKILGWGHIPMEKIQISYTSP